jgi:AcrR family transcriptional regulator
MVTIVANSTTMTSTETESQLRSWRGVPLETRRAERREQLVEAAFELLGTDGWSGTTVRGVCRAARLNPRYFYESFDTLESLFIAVFDRLILEVTRAAVRAIDRAGPDPAARSTAVIEATVRYVTDDPKRARILFVEALGNEAVGRRRLDTLHATAEFLERYAWRQTGLADDRIGMVASHLLVGGLTQLVITWLDGRLPVTLEELVDDAAALMVAVGAGAASTARGRRPGGTPAGTAKS